MCNIYKKQIALFAIFMAIGFSTIAQTYTDTVAPFSGRKAFRTWSVGLNAGVAFPAIAWGGTNNFSNPQITLGYGANIKYQAAHWFAVQLDLLRANLKGNQDNKLDLLNQQPREAFPQYRSVKSFDTEIHLAASLNAVFTLGNINWLVARSKIIPYISLGGGMAWYKPTIVARVPTPGQPGVFTTSAPRLYKPNGESLNHFFVPIGLGFKFNLTRSMNLDLGYRAHYMDADDLDGYHYADLSTGPGQPGLTLHKDKFSYAFLGVEFALGSKSKPQLMFDNPASRMNSNLQNQIDILRSQLDFKDLDGDGVMDQFDKEPNTPAGCPVDTHGVTRDTDGDGVPDCKDQQLITPTECQPVDANGVGKCPPPDCCNNMVKQDSSACNLTDLPSLSFRGSTSTLNADAKSILASVAGRLKGSPACSITITGYPAASKSSQALCNSRTEAIRTYLMNNEGISADRLNVNCEVGGGDANTIDLKIQ